MSNSARVRSRPLTWNGAIGSRAKSKNVVLNEALVWREQAKYTTEGDEWDGDIFFFIYVASLE